MPSTKLLLGLAALCFLSSGASAQDINCENSETQTDLQQCEQSRYQKADKALNEQWSLALAEIADEQDGEQGIKRALLNAQRAWITYRDLQCKVVGFQARGGTLEPAIVAGCLAYITGYRVEELKTFVESIKGN